MTHFAAAIVISVFAWWVSTGLVIMMARAGVHLRPLIIAITAALAVAGVAGLWWSSDQLSVTGAYAGFFSALALWAVHEILFLTGEVTGPNRKPLPAGTTGVKRFRLAFAAIRDHEIGLFVTGLAIIVFLVSAANPTGALVYGLMWLVRLSTKITVFLGAPNAISELLPARLSHLKSYFRTDRVHPFVGLALVLIAAMTVAAFIAAGQVVGEASTVTFAILGSFAALALVEHAFLILPLQDAALWRWALRDHATKNQRSDRAAQQDKKKSDEAQRAALAVNQLASR